MTRLFLAVAVRLYNYEQIKKEFGIFLEGKWREEEHLHVTIAFLGQQFEPDTLLEKLSGFDFSFEPSELTAFDYFAKSRVFVASTQNSTLQSLYERLGNLLGLEYADLKPHVTLMRVKKITDSDLFFDRLTSVPAEPVGLLESRVILYKSVLSSDGAVYQPLQEWLV